MRLAGWKKTAKNDQTYLSLKLQPEGEQGARRTRDDDEVPS
jgi:hypothetical protein